MDVRINFELRWPLAKASTVERMRQENTALKSALHEANKELAKHRQLIAAIRDGRVDIVSHLDRIAREEGAKRSAAAAFDLPGRVQH